MIDYLKYKKKLERIIPKFMFKLIILSWRIFFELINKEYHTKNKYMRLYLKQFGYNINYGLFKGMKYINFAIGSELLFKLIGTYEKELNPTWKQLFKNKYTTFIDIGSAEGYYLIGVAQKIPTLQNIIGYDIEPEAIEHSGKLIVLNEIKQDVLMRLKPKLTQLNNDIDNRTLILCDCEGFEKDYLDPQLNPRLKDSDMLVETHELVIPDIVKILTDRFKHTHNIKIIKTELRTKEELNYINNFIKTEDMKHLELERGDPKQRWLMLTRK